MLIIAIFTISTTIVSAGPGSGFDDLNFPIVTLPIEICPCCEVAPCDNEDDDNDDCDGDNDNQN